MDQSTPLSSGSGGSSSSKNSSSSSSTSSASSTSSSSTSRHLQKTIKRQPLVIKYYNERSLADILELHFSCSLSKHNLTLESPSDKVQRRSPEPLAGNHLTAVASEFDSQPHGCLGEPMMYHHDNQTRAYAFRFQDQQQQIYSTSNWQTQLTPPTESISLAMGSWQQQQQQQHESDNNHPANLDSQEKQTSVNQANRNRRSSPSRRVNVKGESCSCASE